VGDHQEDHLVVGDFLLLGAEEVFDERKLRQTRITADGESGLMLQDAAQQIGFAVSQATV